MFWVRGGGLGGRVRVFHGSLGSRGAYCVVVARGTVCFVVEPTFSQEQQQHHNSSLTHLSPLLTSSLAHGVSPGLLVIATTMWWGLSGCL